MKEIVRPTHQTSQEKQRQRRKVIVAASLGTAFEWYDFHLYGTLAPIIAKQYFSGVNETAAYVFALVTFAAGFVGRPFGSLVFGWLGDLVGRKYTFMATIVLMALPTFFVGLLPGYRTVGILAPTMLIMFRILQGLAAGGEYGGALIYVAEHASEKRRGADTSWINAMGAVGIVLALAVTFVVRSTAGETAFVDWAWRIPFVASLVLFLISAWIRLNLDESPIYAEMKAAGKTSSKPIRETFGDWRITRTAISLVLGCTAAVGVMAYTSQFYTQFFLARTLKIDPVSVNAITFTALILSLPAYFFFGRLSDRIGRKPVILGAALVAAIVIQPAFRAMTHFANPSLERAAALAPVVVHANPVDCSIQFNPVSASRLTSSCDIAKSYLAASMISYRNQEVPAGDIAYITIGSTRVSSFDGTSMTKLDLANAEKHFQSEMSSTLTSAGYPMHASLDAGAYIGLVLLIAFLLTLYAAVYSPAGAWMTELFPSRVRYTAISLPYNMGAGWFGGFMPATAFSMVAANGGIYFGLWYPVTVLAIAVCAGFFLLPETSGNRYIVAEDDSPARAKGIADSSRYGSVKN
jgi:MFS family permease